MKLKKYAGNMLSEEYMCIYKVLKIISVFYFSLNSNSPKSGL